MITLPHSQPHTQRDPSIGRDQHEQDRRARIAAMQLEPHNDNANLDYCAHGLSYDGPCAECEDFEIDLCEEHERQAAEPGIERADVEGEWGI